MPSDEKPNENKWSRGGWVEMGYFVYNEPREDLSNQVNLEERLKRSEGIAKWGCGSVGWSIILQTKSHWFDSQSGHMPGLWARSPVGGMQEANDWCFSSSLSLSISISLKIKINLQKSEGADIWCKRISGRGQGFSGGGMIGMLEKLKMYLSDGAESAKAQSFEPWPTVRHKFCTETHMHTQPPCGLKVLQKNEHLELRSDLCLECESGHSLQSVM